MWETYFSASCQAVIEWQLQKRCFFPSFLPFTPCPFPSFFRASFSHMSLLPHSLFTSHLALPSLPPSPILFPTPLPLPLLLLPSSPSLSSPSSPSSPSSSPHTSSSCFPTHPPSSSSCYSVWLSPSQWPGDSEGGISRHARWCHLCLRVPRWVYYLHQFCKASWCRWGECPPVPLHLASLAARLESMCICISIPGSTGSPGMGHPGIVPGILGY